MTLKEKEEFLSKNVRLCEEQYKKKICSKCIGTKQQIDRSCSLLKKYGFEEPSCDWMTNSVNRRCKDIIHELISDTLNNVIGA